MARADMPAAPLRPPARRAAVRAAAGLAIAGLLGYIAVEVRSLVAEFRELREQRTRTDLSAVVGYIDIHSEPSRAEPPGDWCHDEGDATLLWAGWHVDRHEWFRIGRGELSARQVSGPFGRDVARAIDHPIVERAGDPRWLKVPDAALVAGLSRGGVGIAYPIVVLGKVGVVNDTLGDVPVLVVHRPFDPPDASVAAFAPVLDGRRITMGLSGYLIDRRSLLYDRGTQSLWAERGGGLVAVAGPLRGSTLAAVDGVEVLAWSAWRSRHPEGRLVVGADRKKPRPTL